MAATQFSRSGSVNASLIPQLWSPQDFKNTFAANPLIPYMSANDNAIVQVNKDFTAKQGDKVTFDLRALLYGNGQTDDGTQLGLEEAMVFYAMDAIIHERQHATTLSGAMTEQSANKPLRPRGRQAVTEWVGRVNAADIIAALSGLSGSRSFAGQVTGALATDGAIGTTTGNAINTVNAGTAARPTKSATNLRWFGGGQAYNATTINRVASDSAINSASNHLMGPQVIEYVKRMAMLTVSTTGVPITPIRPLRVDGVDYIFFLDPLQIRDLRQNTGWLNAHQYAGEKGNKNPIFNGADSLWDNVLVKPCGLLHKRLSDGTQDGAEEYFDLTADYCASGITVCRALFCGAQAALFAWGKMPVWKEGYTDSPYNVKWAVGADMIYGVQRSIFNSQPFGNVIVDTAVSSAS